MILRKCISLYRLIKNRHNESIQKKEFIYKGEQRRYIFWKKQMQSMGERCLIRPGVRIDYPESIIIGDSVSIQDNCFLSGYGRISIGDNVSIGTGTKIVSSEHNYSYGIIRNNPLIEKPVVIGNNVWIGMDVCILGGSIVNDNTVVGAGSVVKGEIGPGVFAGVPARFIKQLDK